MKKVKVEDIRAISVAILCQKGVPEDEATIIADTIVYAHTRKRDTHGLNRLSIYSRKIDEKLMTAETKITTVKNTPVLSVLDANNGFGQVASFRAMKSCIEKATVHGIAVAGVCNSNNFGTAGYFGEMAVNEGMIGVAMGNAAPALAPPGGTKPVMGTNPICFAFPTYGGETPVVLDMATSTVARGKIRLALRNNEKIPFGWAIDKEGNPTDNPAKALEGSLMPMGGHKGFGLSLMVDIMAGLLTGAAFAGDVKNLNHPTAISRYGHMFLAMNIDFFMEQSEYKEKMKTLIRNVRACGEHGDVSLPGEIEYRNYLNRKEVLELKDTQIKDTNTLAEELNIAVRL